MIKVTLVDWERVENHEVVLPGVPQIGHEVMLPSGPRKVRDVRWNTQKGTVNVILQSVPW